MRVWDDKPFAKRLRRTLEEINADYELVMGKEMNKKERLLELCELMDEVNVFYKLYEIDVEPCPLALALYKKIANSREWNWSDR